MSFDIGTRDDPVFAAVACHSQNPLATSTCISSVRKVKVQYDVQFSSFAPYPAAFPSKPDPGIVKLTDHSKDTPVSKGKAKKSSARLAMQDKARSPYIIAAKVETIVSMV
jgi:hypothetical protein